MLKALFQQRLVFAYFCIVSIGFFSPLSLAQEKSFQEVDIVGLVYVQKEDLRNMLKPYVGKSFEAEEQESLQKEFQEISMFERVSFKFSLNKTLQLFIKERKPIAKVDFKKIWFVDENGVLFDWFGASEPPDVPLIHGPWKTKTDLQKQTPVFQDATLLIQAIEKELKLQPSQVFWDDPLGWTIVFHNHPMSYYIGVQDYHFKLKRLEKVLDEVMSQKDKIFRVDLNFHDRIVVKLRPPDGS